MNKAYRLIYRLSEDRVHIELEMLKAWRDSEDVSQTAFAKKLGLPEMGMIQLALRDSLAKEGFKYEVKLESA